MPNSFFAAYIRPEKYSSESGNIGYELCQQIGVVDAVPGFTKRESDNQTLCVFLGFEGVRLKGVLEAVHGFEMVTVLVTVWLPKLQKGTKRYVKRKCCNLLKQRKIAIL